MVRRHGYIHNNDLLDHLNREVSRQSRSQGVFSFGPILVRWVFSGYYCPVNRKRTVYITGLGNMWCGMAHSMNSVIAGRVVAGMGGGG